MSSSLPVGPDVYYLDVGCRSGDFHSLDYIAAAAQLEVIAGPKTPGYIVRKNSSSAFTRQLDLERNLIQQFSG